MFGVVPRRLVWKFEVHSDLRLNLDRLAIEVIRFVFPLADGVRRSASQYTFSAEYVQIRDIAFFADRGKKLNRPLDAHLHRRGGVNRLDFFKNQSLRNSLRNAESLL